MSYIGVVGLTALNCHLLELPHAFVGRNVGQRWDSPSVDHMRILPAILGLAVACFGCRDRHTSTHEAIAEAHAPEPGVRPSFYDSNNIAEYYGRCPKCQRWVKGYYGHSTYADASGKLVGCVSEVSGTCEYCKLYL